MRIDSHIQKLDGSYGMSNLFDAVGAAANGAFCALSAPVAKTLQLGEDWYNNQNLPGFPSGPTPAGQALRNARGVLCNEVPEDVSDQFVPLLENGQCPGTTYLVRADVSINGNSPIFAGQGVGPGPIQRDKGANVPTGARDVLLDANGNTLSGGGTSAVDGTYDLVNISITPTDGPDNCGGTDPLPPESYNPTDFTTTTNVTYEDNSQNNVTVPVGFVFAPVQVDVDGRITIPTRIEISPDVFIDAEIDMSTGDLRVVNNIDVTNVTPTDDPTILTDPTGTPGLPETADTEIERSIIGVFVKSTIDPNAVEASQRETSAAGSEFYVPRLGSVNFLCEILSATGLAYTTDIDIKMTEQIIPCPVPWGAKGVSVTAGPGVSVQTTLIRGESRRDLWLSAAGVE